MTMGRITTSYWLKHKFRLLAYGVIGVFVVWLVHWHASSNHNRGLVSMICGAQLIVALLFSPFALKTEVGRIWLTSFAIFVGGVTLLDQFNLSGVALWLSATVIVCAMAVGGCLRWPPPTN